MGEAPFDFAFTDAQWSALAKELESIGRLDSGGERWLMEMLASVFVHSRKVWGKGRKQPKKAREAWLRVADAATELQAAIKALGPAGAADFSFLDNHSERIKEWAANLPSVAQGGRIAAEYETYGIKADANNADPARDHFLQQIIGVWHSYGGKVRASVNRGSYDPQGPLIRFVDAAADPVFASLDEQSPSLSVIREAVRAHPAYGK